MKIRDRLPTLVLLHAALFGLVACGPGQSGTPADFTSLKFEASPVSVPEGGLVTLTWNAGRATHCVASGDWTGERPVAGQETAGPLTGPSTYRLHCFGAGGSADAVVQVSAFPGASTSPFPLAISKNQRYLVNAQGAPFLIQGDAAWSLIAELKREQVLRFLDDRRARGFNTLLVNLLEHKFATRAPSNSYNDAPFRPNGDFSQPNPAYFDHAAWVLQEAAQRGFLVLLVPAYLGFHGDEEGWYKALTAQNSSSLRAYGAYLGARFRASPNIVWTFGGDFNPPDRRVVQEIAAGIRSVDDRRLASAHAAPETSAREFWGDEAWLQLNSVYAYKNVAASAAAEYQRDPAMPFFLVESNYENEQTADIRVVRTQAYQALLSGAAGQVFGNNPIWHFSGPGLKSQQATWEASLDSPGARSMSHLLLLFSAHDWWSLIPDLNGKLLQETGSPSGSRPIAAIAADRSFALAYLPTLRTIRLDLKAVDCHACTASWFDPSSGAYGPTVSFSSQDSGLQQLTPPGLNSAGAQDWALVVSAAPKRTE